MTLPLSPPPFRVSNQRLVMVGEAGLSVRYGFVIKYVYLLSLVSTPVFHYKHYSFICLFTFYLNSKTLHIIYSAFFIFICHVASPLLSLPSPPFITGFNSLYVFYLSVSSPPYLFTYLLIFILFYFHCQQRTEERTK